MNKNFIELKGKYVEAISDKKYFDNMIENSFINGLKLKNGKIYDPRGFIVTYIEDNTYEDILANNIIMNGELIGKFCYACNAGQWGFYLINKKDKILKPNDLNVFDVVKLSYKHYLYLGKFYTNNKKSISEKDEYIEFTEDSLKYFFIRKNESSEALELFAIDDEEFKKYNFIPSTKKANDILNFDVYQSIERLIISLNEYLGIIISNEIGRKPIIRKIIKIKQNIYNDNRAIVTISKHKSLYIEDDGKIYAPNPIYDSTYSNVIFEYTDKNGEYKQVGPYPDLYDFYYIDSYYQIIDSTNETLNIFI